MRASTLAEGRILQYGGAARFTASLPASTTLTSTTAFRKLEYDVVHDADITELDLTAVHLQEAQHQWSEEVTDLPTATAGCRGSPVCSSSMKSTASRRRSRSRCRDSRIFSIPKSTADTRGSVRTGDDRRDAARVGDGRAPAIPVSTRPSTTRVSSRRSIAPVTVVPGTAYSYTDAISHTAWTPKFGLEFRARDNAFAYVSATRGFKSGGFNFTSPEAGRGYAPEWAWSYEGGLKTTVAGGRANDQCRRLPYRLHRSAGADRHPAGRDRHFECRRGDDPRRRARGHDASHGRPARRRTSGVAGSHVRSVHRRRRRAVSRAMWPAIGSPTPPNGRGGSWLQWNGSLGRAGRGLAARQTRSGRARSSSRRSTTASSVRAPMACSTAAVSSGRRAGTGRSPSGRATSRTPTTSPAPSAHPSRPSAAVPGCLARPASNSPSDRKRVEDPHRRQRAGAHVRAARRRRTRPDVWTTSVACVVSRHSC